MKLEKEFSKIPIIQEIDALKKEVDALRPFTPEIQNRIMQKFRLDWNYHSNAIEGNPYTYGETVAFIMHGITAKGKKLKDHLDIKGHDDAVQFLTQMVKSERNFTETDIRGLHKMILKEPYSSPAVTPDGQQTSKMIKLGEYKDAPNHVKTVTGEMHYYATPEETPIKMAELVNWINEVLQNKEVHPLVAATLFHHKFVAIHPFDDGNGRLGRILMNFILMKKGFPPLVIKQEDRLNYYAVLSQADSAENLPLVEYLGEELKRSLDIQLRGAKGEDISELSDLDKEIALIKLKLKNDKELVNKNFDTVNGVFRESIVPLFLNLFERLKQFEELFFRTEVYLYSNGGEKEVSYKIIGYDYYNDINQGLPLPRFIKNLVLSANFFGFKKNENPFNIECGYRIDFEDYKYRILKTGNKETLFLEKKYDENITIEEQRKIIQDIITKDFIEVIKTKTKI